MLTVDDLHKKAMDLAEAGFLAHKKGQLEQAKIWFQKALELEKQAANLLSQNQNAEPTRTILYRSAAALAYHSEQYDLADELIMKGISDYSPPEIKQELKELAKKVTFQRHLNQIESQFESEPIYLKGILRYADSTNNSQLGIVKLVEPDTHQKHNILVPITLMKLIVKPYYEENVIITAFSNGKEIYFGAINSEV